MKTLDADVLLLAAGFGKRLLPLTQSKPKPLIEVNGKPLLDYAIDMAVRSGVKRLIINLHYCPDQIRAHVGTGESRGIEVLYSYEPTVLDTGGAIKNIESLLTHDVLMTVNSDTLFGPDFSLAPVLQQHRSSHRKPPISMVLRHDPEQAQFGELGVDSEGFLTSFLSQPYRPEAEVDRLMYAGIQAMDRSVLAQMPEAGIPFSVTSIWRGLLAADQRIGSFQYPGYWNDVGTPERLALARQDAPAVFNPS